MPFTGALGTVGSGLSNIGLGTLGSGPTVRTVQARANIFGTTTRTVQARARIGFATTTRTVQARANILITVHGTCEVDFNVFPTITQRCLAQFNASDKVVSYRTVQAKARILQTTTATVGVTYTVNYPMPNGILRPTERTTFS
jgi:hypothetical protein